MSSANFVELSSDEEIGKSGGKKSKRSLDSVLGTVEHKQNNRTKSNKVRRKSRSGQELEENISSVACTTSQNGSSVLDQGPSPLDKSSPSSVPGLGSAPICRQFWKAGNYNLGEGSKTHHQTIAELLDNAVDEIQNGATSVVIDKTTNPRDGNPALLIQDDGGGMDPETIRRCMSFGFSDKKTKSSIGQYGNGFKTGSMRLGEDVIVFTRRLKKRTLSQSVGLLSYTFLRQSGHDRIIVPLLDYEFNPSTEKSEPIFSYGKEHFSSNLSVLLQWSPYSTEEMLLKQFDDVGHHGTKIVIYNLWLNDNGDTELDFDFDMEDIRVNGDPKLLRSSSKNSVFDHHIANLYRFSLRVYSSFLYLRLPQDFKIILRGRVVEHHHIADDLKFHEFILYKPHGEIKAGVVTTIGFLKDAPRVNIHGFNVYHKNRLILPFWRVKHADNSTARGVVGILEVNFIEPTHDKQDFEKTSVFQKLEARLKDMTMEYWHLHCGLIGYQLVKKKPTKPKPSQDLLSKANRFLQPLVLNQSSSASVDVQPVSPAVESSEDVGATRSYDSTRPEKFVNNGPTARRKEQNPTGELEHGKCQLGSRSPSSDTPPNGVKQAPQSRENQLKEQELTSMMQENKKLCSQLLELEKGEKDLNLKVQQLWSELGNLESEYVRMLAELDAIDKDARNTDG